MDAYVSHILPLLKAVSDSLMAGVDPDQPNIFVEKVQERASGAFNALTSAMKLRLPQHGDEVLLDTDASDSASGAILSVVNPRTGQEEPVAFTNRSFNSVERNYPAIKRELLAISQALKRWPYLIMGHKLTIRTDHRPLTHLATIDTRDRRVCGMILEILAFEPTIIWRAGSQLANADGLTRLTHVPRKAGKDDHLFRRQDKSASAPADADTAMVFMISTITEDGVVEDAAMDDSQ